MKIIQHNDRIVALIFQPDESNTPGTTFFTPSEVSMQVGYLKYRSGESIQAHTHRSVRKTVEGITEVAIVQSGSCEATLYTEEGVQLTTQTLKSGEALVMLSGGHSFRMLEDTVLYLIKQGPFTGDEDKLPL